MNEEEYIIETARAELAATAPHERLITSTERAIGHMLADARSRGDKHMVDICGEILFRANLGEAYKPAEKFFQKRKLEGQPWEDFLGAAFEGIARALSTYDGRNRFSTYAHYWIIQRLQRTSGLPGVTPMQRAVAMGYDAKNGRNGDTTRENIRKLLPPMLGGFVSPLPPTGGVGGTTETTEVESIDCTDIFSGEHSGDDPSYIIQQAEILSMVKSLPQPECTLVEQVVLDGRKCAEVARELGIPVGQARLMLALALHELKKYFVEQ